MRAVAQHVWTAIESKVTPTIPVPDMVATIVRTLAMLDAQIQLLTVRTNDLMRDVIANETASDSDVSYQLRDTMHEMERAASSIRELTDYLRQNPNSVLFGKSKEK